MTHLILGGAGQLAQSFQRLLGERAHSLDRRQADLLGPASLKDTLDRLRPAVVLNCAAYNQVDRAETDGVAAWTVNALAPAAVADWCQANDALLVHFSTNYVFGLEEARATPYRETDIPGPVSVYGSTKLAGEHFVLSRSPRALVIRTCGLFGRRGAGEAPSNFVATMLRVAGQGKPLRVVEDQICTPTYTDDLAVATLSLLETRAKGLFHVTNAGQCTWFEFARSIFEERKLTPDLTPIPSAAYPVPARRPLYSVLDCTRLSAVGVRALRPWRDALRDYLASESQVRNDSFV